MKLNNYYQIKSGPLLGICTWKVKLSQSYTSLHKKISNKKTFFHTFSVANIYCFFKQNIKHEINK